MVRRGGREAGGGREEGRGGGGAPALGFYRDFHLKILAMRDESFRIFYAAFHSTKSIHCFVHGPEIRHRVLAGVRVTCRLLAAYGLGNIDIVGGVKDLRLQPWSTS